jgi:hypothetical protein
LRTALVLVFSFLRFMFSFIGPTDNFLVVLKRELEFEDALGKSNGELNKVIDKDAISQRLDEIYKRLDVIDADSAESRAASILAVSS